MKENGFGSIFLRHLAMALPWGVVFLVVILIAVLGIKQQVKEGIQYTVMTCAQETARLPYVHARAASVKQNIKEGIEFVSKMARSEIKALLADPQVKQDIKEALEYTFEKVKQ